MEQGSGLFIFAVSQVLMHRSSNICKIFWPGILLTFREYSARRSVYSPFFALAEILFGGVYIWGNPQLCFPDPQSINWTDILDQRNTDTRHRLQPRAQNCERQVNRQTPQLDLPLRICHRTCSIPTRPSGASGSEPTELSVVWDAEVRRC